MRNPWQLRTAQVREWDSGLQCGEVPRLARPATPRQQQHSSPQLDCQVHRERRSSPPLSLLLLSVEVSHSRSLTLSRSLSHSTLPPLFPLYRSLFLPTSLSHSACAPLFFFYYYSPFVSLTSDNSPKLHRHTDTHAPAAGLPPTASMSAV